MKNVLILLILLLSHKQVVFGQSAFVGTWEGKLNAGVELRMIFHIVEDAGGGYLATMDCPDQGLKGVKANTKFRGDSIYVDITQFQARYAAKLEGENSMSGVFKQGMSFPLNMKKILIVEEIKRAQTPVAPFPYTSEDLLYTNGDKTISYGATITIPNGKGPFPAVLLLTGSGQQNRDEELAGHKPFAVIADHLTRNGFIVLRVDDRGMGKSTGDFRKATTRDFADDATVSLSYLKTRPEVNTKKIGLIGHSEGGMIAQMLAAERSDIDFVIFLAAPGDEIKKLMHDQNQAILLKAGLPQDYVSAYLNLYNSIVTATLASQGNVDEAVASVDGIVDRWIKDTPANIVATTTAIKDEQSKKMFVKGFVSQLSIPWFRYFLSYDPSVNIKKMKSKVLALNGSKDVQVISTSNLAAIESALKAGRSKKFEVKELDGLNHLFQECKECTVNEYGKLEQTISPKALDTMTSWMLANLIP